MILKVFTLKGRNVKMEIRIPNDGSSASASLQLALAGVNMMTIKNKINPIIFLSLFLVSSSCSSQKIGSFKYYLNNPSHELMSSILQDSLTTYSDKKIKSAANILILHVDQINSEQSNIYFKSGNLQIEQENYHYSDNPIKPDGYCLVNKVLVLLYGDIDSLFKKIRQEENILATDKRMELMFSFHSSFQHYRYNANENTLEFLGLKDRLPR